MGLPYSHPKVGAIAPDVVEELVRELAEVVYRRFGQAAFNEIAQDFAPILERLLPKEGA